MPQQTIILSGLLKLIPWGKFDRLAAAHGAVAKGRRLRCKDHLATMLYAQLTGAASLRDIEAAMQSQAGALHQVGVRPVRRATLAEANAYRSAEVFRGLLAEMLARAHPQLRGAVTESLYLLDSTSLKLNRHSEWARFSAEVYGAKVHVVYDPHADCPTYALVTPAKVNDITVARQIPIQSGATYVADLGYYDFGWWAQLDAANCRFVTRLKINTPLKLIETREVAQDQPAILSDCVGSLPARQAKNRKNPMAKPLREVRVRLETGSILRIVSNDLTAPAATIAALYKQRWGIELFFRWIKQTLKIRHFYGTSENAVRIQVAVALITFLLLRLAHRAQSGVPDLLTFVRLVADNLMHRRPIDRLLDKPPKPPPRFDQLDLGWA